MIKNRLFRSRNLFLLSILLLASACAPQMASTPFIPPTKIPIPTSVITRVAGTTPTPIPATDVPVTPTATLPCTNDLGYLQDLSVPDGTIVSAGSIIDKQWLVQNSGTCDWDDTYRLKLVGGDTMNAASEQTLFPARAGSQATLRILFTAPFTPGTYQSAWQAFDKDGNAFGDPIFMEVIVQ
jgi:hypothetical protein